MKRMLALVLVLCLMLCACSKNEVRRKEKPTEPVATEAPTEPSTEPPTTEPPTEPPTTEPPPVYTHPLNGKMLDEPFDGRIIAASISNVYYALPHYGTMQADILMEMWVNGSIIRDLALFSDPYAVPQIGSIRSDRMMFNQIIQHYDAVLLDAGGDGRVLSQAEQMGVDRYNVYADTNAPTAYSYRDMGRDFMFSVSDKYEHALFVNGDGLPALAEERGFSLKQDPEKEYFLNFVEDGTPADGEDCSMVKVTFKFGTNLKITSMVYNEELGKYVYNQYEKEMIDGATGEPECFNNVIIMLPKVTMNQIYHVADFVAGGEGWFACGGKIIPITWTADDEYSPFQFFTEDGEPLNLNVGNTYIAIAPQGSPVVYE